MYLQQLRYFIAVARLQSFTAAAGTLHISQPALSMQVRQLEEHLGVGLLKRLPRGVILTEAGAVFFEHAEAVLAEIERGERAVDRFKSPASVQLSLGVTPATIRFMTAEFLRDCALAEPRLLLQTRQGVSEDLWRCVSIGELDATFCYDPPHIDSIALEPLLTEDFFLIGRPDVVGFSNEDISFAALSEFQIILDRAAHNVRHKIDVVARIRQADIRIMAELSLDDVGRALVEQENYCTVAPYPKFIDLILRGKIIGRRIADPIFNRTLVLALNKALPEIAAATLLSQIRSAINDKVTDGIFGWRGPGDVPALAGLLTH